VAESRQQGLRDDVHDAQFVRVESGGEAVGIELRGLPVRFVVDILTVLAECRGLHVLDELVKVSLGRRCEGESDLGMAGWEGLIMRIPTDVNRATGGQREDFRVGRGGTIINWFGGAGVVDDDGNAASAGEGEGEGLLGNGLAELLEQGAFRDLCRRRPRHLHIFVDHFEDPGWPGSWEEMEKMRMGFLGD
jgi:hypothetical protein